MNILPSLKSFFKTHELGKPILAFILVYVFSAIVAPDRFLSLYNQRSLLLQAAPWIVMASGEAFAILMGSIDLSAGSVTALSSIISGLVLLNTGSFTLAVLAGLGIGILAGLTNGLLITRLKIFSFVTTLAMLVGGRGLVLAISEGKTYTNLSKFSSIGGSAGGIPVPFIIALLFVILTWIILKKTTIGRYIYAIGGNEEAVRYSGIRAENVKMFAFTYAGFAYGIAGLLFNGILLAAYPWLAYGGELTAIASSVLGGIQLTGGVGSPIGPAFGAYIMTMVTNILVILGFSADLQYIVTGIILVVASAFLTRGLKYVK